jgi:hypothetical protein
VPDSPRSRDVHERLRELITAVLEYRASEGTGEDVELAAELQDELLDDLEHGYLQGHDVVDTSTVMAELLNLVTTTLMWGADQTGVDVMELWAAIAARRARGARLTDRRAGARVATWPTT